MMNRNFRLILTVLVSFSIANIGWGQTNIWTEDFNAAENESVGAVGPTPTITSPSSGKWSVNVDSCDLSADTDWFRVENYLFEARDVDGTQQANGTGDGAIWTSEAISIFGYTNVSISVDVFNSGTFEDRDFIKASYQVDSGAETQFGHLYDDFSPQTFSVSGLSGTSLVIYIEVDNNAGTEYTRFDNVEVTGTAAGEVVTPTDFSASVPAQPNSASQIELSWTDNDNGDNVLLAWNSSNTFGTPTDGDTYSNGDYLGGATVLQYSRTDSYSHSSLTANTTYYYKVWSYDNSNYSSGVETNATTAKVEPTNHASSFAASADGHSKIDLSWGDNDGSQAADGFLIVGKTGASDFYSPADGTDDSDDTDWSNDEFEVTVLHGSESYSATGLDAETTYNFKIYPYTNFGSSIDFKIDSTVPSASATTGAAQAIPALIISEVSDPGDNADARFVEIYNNSGSIVDFDKNTWYISRQANGGNWGEAELADSLNAGDVFIVSYKDPSTFNTYYGVASDQQEGGVVTGNGDDGYFLYFGGDHSTGTLVDAFGIIDQDGTGEAWEYEDSRAIRGVNQTVTEGNATWTTSEWTITSANVADCTPGTIESDQSLPVTLTSFTAEVQGSAVQLSWVTESEIRNQGFIVERKASESGEFIELSSFRTNSELKGAGSTSERQTYTFTDEKVEQGKRNWYRLKDVSFDGKVATHGDRVLKVTVENQDYNSIEMEPPFPNPFNAQTRLTYYLPESARVAFHLYDTRGVKLSTLLNTRQPAGSHDLFVSMPDYPSGVYFVRMDTDRTGLVQKLLLIK